MIKLFVALDLPASIKETLTAVQPKAEPHIRLVDPAQMHITLYYIGDADLAQTLKTLDQVNGDVFQLTIQELGKFQTTHGKTILWAGVQATPQLHQLHQNIASILHSQGVQKETGPYTPHVTLARCGSRTSTDVIETFLKKAAMIKLTTVQITDFGLYTSTIINNMLVYTLEQSYCLKKSR